MLRVPWSDASIAFEEKFNTFFDAMTALVARSREAFLLRTLAYISCLFYLIRIITFLRVQPRIAVLYLTLMN